MSRKEAIGVIVAILTVASAVSAVATGSLWPVAIIIGVFVAFLATVVLLYAVESLFAPEVR